MGANLKEVRTRIKSVISTQQITKAMKMVSAAKLRRAQTAIQDMRPYSNKLSEMLSNILSSISAAEAGVSYGVERPIQNVLVVCVTSNRGLCGGFNSNLIKETNALIKEKYSAQRKAGNLSIMCIGRKAFDAFKKEKDITLLSDDVELFKDLTFDNSAPIAEGIMEAFSTGKYDAVDVIYSRFKNAAMQFSEVSQFLPVPKMENEEAKDDKMVADFSFEPSRKELLDNLIPSILKTQFHKYLLETHASEHGARMTSMDAATENAEDLLKELKINYNKARQEAITNEISEIVGGAMALEGA